MKQFMGSCFTCLMVTAVALTALFWLFGEPLFWPFGCSEETIIYTLPYMCIYASGFLFVMMALGMNLFVTTQGFATVSMRTVLIGAVSNIILDPIFIYGLHMGVEGAALATVISQAVSGFWVVRFLTGKKTTLRLRWSTLRPSWCLMAPVLALGVSPFVMQSTEALLNISSSCAFMFTFWLLVQLFPRFFSGSIQRCWACSASKCRSSRPLPPLAKRKPPCSSPACGR